jgi:hypothetical protein
MGRPIGSVNREKPFNDALRIALKRDPRRLPRIAEKLAEKAEEGDLAAIREIAECRPSPYDGPTESLC